MWWELHYSSYRLEYFFIINDYVQIYSFQEKIIKVGTYYIIYYTYTVLYLTKGSEQLSFTWTKLGNAGSYFKNVDNFK